MSNSIYIPFSECTNKEVMELMERHKKDVIEKLQKKEMKVHFELKEAITAINVVTDEKFTIKPACRVIKGVIYNDTINTN
jgi:uncharacterized protein YajQ (UPF0234 family)